jgi:hypothetical protein
LLLLLSLEQPAIKTGKPSAATRARHLNNFFIITPPLNNNMQCIFLQAQTDYSLTGISI